jgi:hypothetical protein
MLYEKEFRGKEKKTYTNVLGQNCFPQIRYLTAFPNTEQFSPPFFGVGLSHERRHISTPLPHVMLHLLLICHLP